MQQLDDWVESNIIAVLTREDGAPEREIPADVLQQVKGAIRQKMQVSYRNGQQAGGRPARRVQ
jgi:antitoxin component of MazEF toxin-antitoxin module